MYELLFVLLLVEALAAAALLLPLSSSARRSLVRLIDQSSLTAAAAPYAKFVPAAIGSAWVYTLLEITRAQNRLVRQLVSTFSTSQLPCHSTRCCLLATPEVDVSHPHVLRLRRK